MNTGILVDQLYYYNTVVFIYKIISNNKKKHSNKIYKTLRNAKVLTQTTQ